MEHAEDALDQEHGHRVEQIHKRLVRDNVALLALCKLDHAEDAAPDDDGRRGEEDVEEVAPGVAAVGWDGVVEARTCHPSVEDDRDDKEEAEESELDEEPDEEDVLPQRGTIGLRHQSGAGELQQKREHVSRHEYLGDPLRTDKRCLRRVYQTDDAAVDHVHSRRVQRGRQDDEETLQHIRHELAGILSGDVSTGVSC